MKIFLSSVGLALAVQTTLIAADIPSYQSSGQSYCFKAREIMYPLEETFDALKQTLMQSNLNIATVTKSDGVLTAKGNQYNADEDTIIGITLTVDFKEREKGKTSVRAIASYETVAKKSDTGQIGGGGITLPIPVPFTGKYTLVGQGNIDDSTWYRGFFNSLEKILFENHMKYSHIKKEEPAPILVKVQEEPKVIVPPVVIPKVEEKIEPKPEVIPPKEEIKEVVPQEQKAVEEPAKVEEAQKVEPKIETPKTEEVQKVETPKTEEVVQQPIKTEN